MSTSHRQRLDPPSKNLDPLQQSIESLSWQWRTLRVDLSHSVRDEAPEFAAALDELTFLADSAHQSPPELLEGDRDPSTVPSLGLYDAAIDARPIRHISEIWNGQGDYDDPLIPQDEYEHEVVLERLRADPEADWAGGDVPVRVTAEPDQD